MAKLSDKKRAVAVKYDKGRSDAPVVTAKGRGHLAEKIIETAKIHNIPTYEDHNLSEVLQALELNCEIPEDLYKAVAEVLVFVYKMNNRKP